MLLWNAELRNDLNQIVLRPNVCISSSSWHDQWLWSCMYDYVSWLTSTHSNLQSYRICKLSCSEIIVQDLSFRDSFPRLSLSLLSISVVRRSLCLECGRGVWSWVCCSDQRERLHQSTRHKLHCWSWALVLWSLPATVVTALITNTTNMPRPKRSVNIARSSLIISCLMMRIV